MFVNRVRSTISLTFCFLFLALADVPAADLNPAAVLQAAECSGKPSRHFLPRHSKWKDAARGVSRPRCRRYATADLQRDESFLESGRSRRGTRWLAQFGRSGCGYDPSWREDSRKSRVTIRQLLDFSCGLDPGFRLQVTVSAIATRPRSICRWSPSQEQRLSMGRAHCRCFTGPERPVGGPGAARISRAPCLAPVVSARSVILRPSGQSAPRGRLGPDPPTMGEDRKAGSA